MQVFTYDKLRVQRYENRAIAGKEAGEWAAMKIKELLKTHETLNVLFGAAPSQDEVLASFIASDVDFSRLNALHMDEYIGLSDDAPQRFGHYLDEHVFKLAPFRNIFYVACGEDGEATRDRYEKIIAEYPIDVAFIGIGENGHIAFNDPPADFDTKEAYIVVNLDDACKNQQVGEGWFPTIDDVPKQAISMTVYQILKCKKIITCVPHEVKAKAIYATLNNEISNMVPATMLRTHPDWSLYIDENSAKLIK